MTTPNAASTPEPGPDASVENIRADIEATRTDLGQTVEALSAKLDVTAQAKQKVDDTKDLLADKTNTLYAKGSELGSQIVDLVTDDGSVRPVIPVAAAVVAVLMGVVLWTRRRR